MFKTKLLANLTVAALVGLLCACASGQQLYVESGTRNDVLRYDASLNAAPAPAQSGAVFFDFPSTLTEDGFAVSQSQNKNLAVGPDGFLYFTARDDRPYSEDPAYQWGEGSNYVRRIDMATGVCDSTWKVPVGGSTESVCGSLAFTPNGRLYVVERTYGTVYQINIPAQTAKQVTPTYVPAMAFNVTFDDTGRGYVSSYNNNVIYRYDLVEWQLGVAWNKDTGYEAYIPTGLTWAMAYKDGWLYVNNYYSPEGDQVVTRLYRIDSTGVCDPNWVVENVGDPRCGDMSFGPDGKLYTAGWNKVTRVDVTSTPPVAETVIAMPEGDNTLSVVWSRSTPTPPDALSIHYDGRLLDNGAPMNGTASVKFGLFNTETGKYPLWSTGALDVPVVNGAFSKSIEPVFASLFQHSSDLWLQVTANNQVMTPRVKLEAAPYAAKSYVTDQEVEGTSPVANVSISYQGELLDNGQPVNGTANIKYDLFGAAIGGISLWSGTASGVTVTDGVFSKSIGTVSPTLFQQYSSLWLEITANGQVVSPRIRLETAPYAARSFRTMP